MLVGLYQFSLLIPESGSLKEKRFVISSIKDRIRNKFNVSIAETDDLDKWQRATIGIAMVSNEKAMLDKVFTKIFNFLDENDQVEILEHQKEIL